MFDARRGGCADRHRLRHPAAPDDSPYVETDPTGRYGRYEETLGKGAMKTVYRAFDELQGVEVAWNQAKICDVLRSPEALERLYSEVHLLSTLSHESIIQFHASWVDAGRRTFNFITEMFTSGTLREYRQRYRSVSIRAVKNWTRQILNGLVYLHGHDPPVIHRDLKCDNIFVNGHLGQVKIGDLGLAAVLRGSQPAHSVIGTPEFMAPELYEEEYNELVDVYSFGMCVLEMLTGEYPYSECSNPAQIYKKVTSGKLPEAFHRVQNLDARRFIGRCLENVAKRASAAELLDDPFLQIDDVDPVPSLRSGFGNSGLERQCSYQPAQVCQNRALSSEMKITGKMNPEDDTILLRVQISDRNGLPQNIYFPFDILSDTPMDVANEMVKELEIERDPAQIAKVIDQEISALVPHWRDEMPYEHQHSVTHVYNYREEEDYNQQHHHQFYMSSPTPSSHGSSFGHLPLQGAECHSGVNWLQGFQSVCKADDDDDETTSQISIYSANYSYVNVSYNSNMEQDASPSPQSHKSSRFQPDDYASKFHRQCSLSPESSVATGHSVKRPAENNSRKLTRNRSLVDIRSQLLHQSLVEEVNKRIFNTVGSMENIGYMNPYDCSSNKGKKTASGASRGRRG